MTAASGIESGALPDGDYGKAIRLGMYVLALGFGGFFAWAILAPLDEGIPAPGVISVESKRKHIDHLTGGIIEKILVSEGEHVTEGQDLIVLDELQAKDFISEQRAADSVVRRRGSRLGTARVRQELMAKGLETDIVAAAVQTLRATEQIRAREVWRKKFGEAAPDASGQVKQMRFLAARGFAPDAIRRVVAGGDDDDF